MVEECKKAGAKVILVTPPSFDIRQFGDKVSQDGGGSSGPFVKYADVLGAYAKWEVSTKPGGSQVIDIFTPMMNRVNAKSPLGYDLYSKGDGIHPNEVGHVLMSQLILQGLSIPIDFSYPPDVLAEINTDPLFKLVAQHRYVRSEGWLASIGYTRGETVKANVIVATEDKAREIQAQVDAARRK